MFGGVFRCLDLFRFTAAEGAHLKHRPEIRETNFCEVRKNVRSSRNNSWNSGQKGAVRQCETHGSLFLGSVKFSSQRGGYGGAMMRGGVTPGRF